MHVDEVVGVCLGLGTVYKLLAGVLLDAREQRGAVCGREDDLLWDELVVYYLLVVVAADDREDAEDDDPRRGDRGDRGQAGELRQQRVTRRLIGLWILAAWVGWGLRSVGSSH